MNRIISVWGDDDGLLLCRVLNSWIMLCSLLVGVGIGIGVVGV